MSKEATDGRRIGNYLLAGELGRGGMGVVYAATDLRSGRNVALKLIAPHLLRDPRQHKRLLREARATSRLRHPGLVQMYGYHYGDAEQPYLVMERVPGSSLRAELSAAPQNRLPVDLAIDITLQLAGVLSYLHKSRIVHRDIKPSNIMLLPAGEPSGRTRIKLLDFGLARSFERIERTTQSSSEITGTPAYMSPEQCQGAARIDGGSDVYALGALLFEMLCGRPPFIGDPPRIMFQHVYESPPDPQKLRPELPEELSLLIRKMLSKSVARRPDLSALAEELASGRRGSFRATAAEPERVGRRGAFLGGMLAALVLSYFGMKGWQRYVSRNGPAAPMVPAAVRPAPVPQPAPEPAAVIPRANDPSHSAASSSASLVPLSVPARSSVQDAASRVRPGLMQRTPERRALLKSGAAGGGQAAPPAAKTTERVKPDADVVVDYWD